MTDRDGDVTDLSQEQIDALTDAERDALNDVDAENDEDPDADPGEDPDEEDPDFRAAFVGWVLEHFAVVEVVGTKDRAPWCDRWFDHPEVVARLFAVWQASIQAKLEDSLEAQSNWWLTHWDRHAAVIFDPQNGPFRHCTRTGGHLDERKTKTTQVVVPTVPGPDWTL